MPSRRAVVLSDLHLGPEGPLATFRDCRALVALLDGLAAPGDPPTELVLAGDIFDFLQTDAYDGFDPARAVDRFHAIVAGPQTAPVIAALRRFAARPGAEVTLLSGNHDPEMLLQPVREAFELAIGRPGSVLYADDTPLAPGLGDRLPVWGHALGNDAGTVWIVHGDRWDTHNAIDRDALRRAVAGGHEFKLPVGSQLVYRVLSRLQPENRWIPELKPEFPVVVPLLLYLDPRITLPFLKEHWDLTARLLHDSINGRLHLGSLFGPEADAAPAPEAISDVEQILPSLLAEALRAEAPADPGALLRAWLLASRWTERFQASNGSDGTVGAAHRWLPEALVALIAGHTHGPRRRPADQPAYYNTGTWIPVGRFPQGDPKDIIDAIEAGHWDAEAPRTFATVEWDDGPPAVALWRCDAEGRREPVEGDGA